MKPQFFAPALILLSAVLMLNRTDAQQIAMNNAAEKNTTFLQEKKIADEPSAITDNRIAAKINFHARKDFTIKYKDVNNATWYDVDGGSVAKFLSGDVATSVTYKKNGEWLQTIRCYNEKCMPKDVRAVVKGTYYDYNIVNIEEVQLPNKDNNIFLVYVQDANSIKVLRVYDGEMEVLHDYTRG